MKKDRTTFRVQINSEEKELYFRNPNQEELLMLDLEYRKIFSQGLREGIISEAEAKKIADRNKVWTREDDKKISSIAFEIGILESIVKNDDKKSDDKQIEDAIGTLSERRSELISLINQKVEVVSNTAEGLAGQQRMHKFVQLCCVIASDNSRLFSNLSSYEDLAQEDPDTVSEIYKQAYFHEYGNPENLTKEWPEIKYIKDKVEESKKQQEKVEVELPKIDIKEVKEPEVKETKARKKKDKSLVNVEK